MANTSRYNLGIGRGRGRARGMTLCTENQLPHTKPESVFAPSSVASSHSSSTPASQGNDSTFDPGAGGDTLGNSRLSAEADEFYPRNYKADSSKEMVTHLLDIVDAITVDPGSYKSTVQPFLESFDSVLSDSYVLDIVLNIIIKQSIEQPNFRYNGARLLNDLCDFLADSRPEFRSTLLQRCKEEVVEVVKHFESKPIHPQGVVCFLAELYIQLELKPGTRLRINILGDAVYELLELLVSSALPENMKCACMTLKLAGFALDEDNSTAMNTLLQSLHKVALSLPTDTHTAAMVDNIEQLRLASWGTSSTAEPSLNVTHSLQQMSLVETDPVFYGPDGIVLTHEESTFLQENLAPEMEYYEESWMNGNHSDYECEGDMNEEEEAAYEEFLRMSENNRKQ